MLLGTHEALNLAKETAGERNVWIMGGANTIQQYVKAKLVDELRIHIAPVLLMQGTRLFDNTGYDMVELVKKSVTETPAALHLVFTFKMKSLQLSMTLVAGFMITFSS